MEPQKDKQIISSPFYLLVNASPFVEHASCLFLHMHVEHREHQPVSVGEVLRELHLDLITHLRVAAMVGRLK